MIQAMGSNKEFMNEFESARKERNKLFDSINKNEQHNATRAQDYVNLGKANNRVFEILYFFR